MTDFENTKLITPGEARAVLRVLRKGAEQWDQRAADTNDSQGHHRASALRFAADQIGDLLQNAITEAEAADAERQAERERRQAEQAERDRLAIAHAEAYRNRPILGLREGDVLVDFGGMNTPRWASTTRHIGFEDDNVYRTRCGADQNATYHARPTGDWARDATCKRCLTIAKKEGLL